ncbi:MAG TPA: hypothetical protein VNQ55_08615, partial [Parapedobacter sp.]|nr:hypothetical protein [Parapedobacter sp.]
EWGELAAARLNEIEALVATVPCSKQREAVIESVKQYCGKAYYPVTPSIKTKFDELRAAYEQFSRHRWSTFIDEGGIIDCFGLDPQPIGIGCEDNRLLVYTVRNLPIGKAREMANDLHAKIQQYKDTVSCVASQQWGMEVVQHLISGELEVLPLLYGDNVQEWRYTVADYQVLVRRLWQAAGKESYPRLEKRPIGVGCVDGKPIIEYDAG